MFLGSFFSKMRTIYWEKLHVDFQQNLSKMKEKDKPDQGC